MKKNSYNPTKKELEEKVEIKMTFQEAIRKLVFAPQKEIDKAAELIKLEKSKNKPKIKK
jgi:hypothetical protein